MFCRSPRATAAVCLWALLFVASLTAACASPPNREIADAEQALKAAKAAGAERYSTDSYKAAAEAYRLANEAVLNGDYRLALNRALESREHAQSASRSAAEGQARARDQAQRTMADISAQLTRVTAQLDDAEKSRTMPKSVVRDVREALALINADVQEAGTAINNEDYVAAQEALKGVKARLDAAAGEFDSARKTQRARRRTS
jgi:chromosome segregation ATPase